jgi:HYR domain/Secretion system C-terminal sorting domain/Domain of unknown function DUF11
MQTSPLVVKSLVLALYLSFSVIGFSQTCSNNLLTNSSFDTNLQGWNGTGATWQNGSLQLCQSGQNAIQTVAAQAGQTYKLNYTAKTAGTNQNVLFGVKFLSASWNVLDSEYSSFDSPTGFTSNFIQKAAPVGTAWVEVSIGKTNSGCVQVSEVCLEQVTIQPSQCLFGSVGGAVSCLDEGTKDDPSDDTYTYYILINAPYPGAKSWKSVINGQPVTGKYDIGYVYFAGLIRNGNTNISIADSAYAACAFGVTLSPPLPCSVPAAGACANNLMLNPSFTTNISSWVSTGATWQGGNLELCQSGQNAIQTVAAEAGKTYKLNYTAKTAGTNQNVLFGIKFLSASWNVLGSEYSSFDSPAGFTSSFIQKTAPVGTVWVEVSIGKTNSGCVQVSEVCLENQTIIVNPCSPDVTAPTLSACPVSQTLATIGTSATATWVAPTATDNCAGSVNVTASATSGQAFAVGATTIIYTARDVAQNSATCSFVITVQVVDSLEYYCTGNILKNSRFSFGLDSWISSGATVQVVQFQPNYIKICNLGGYASQKMPAKPEHSYELIYSNASSLDTASFKVSMSFLDNAGAVIKVVFNTVAVAPLGSASVVLKLESKRTDCAFISPLCFIESWTAQSRATMGCPDLVYSGGTLNFIGYNASGDGLFCQKVSDLNYKQVTVKENGTFSVKDTFLVAPNTLTVANNQITESTSSGSIVAVKTLPSAIRDSFFVINGAKKIGGFYFIHGFDKNELIEPVQNILMKVDPVTMQVLAQRRFTANTYVYGSSFYIGVPLHISDLGHGLFAIEVKGGQVAISTTYLNTFSLQIIRQTDLATVYLNGNTSGSSATIYPGYIRVNTQNYQTSGGSSGGCGGSSIRRDTTVIYQIRSNGLEEIARSFFTDSRNCNALSRFGSATLSFTKTELTHSSEHFLFGSPSPTVTRLEFVNNEKVPFSTDHKGAFNWGASIGKSIVQIGSTIFEVINLNGTTEFRRRNCTTVPPSGTCTSNLLANASFDTNLQGWNGTGATWQNGNMQLCQSGQNAIQTVAAEAGKTYKLNYTAKTAGTNQNVLFGIKFLSASWNVLGSEYSSFDSPAGFTSSFIQKTAPVGTVWVEVSIGKTNSGCVQVSEVCLENQTIIVNPCSPDVTAPTLSACPVSQTLATIGTSATATWVAPTATDNCAGSVNVTASATSGQAFAVGATAVTYTARDATQNSATCSFVITVQAQPAGGTCTNNLLINASFDTNLQGWNGAGATWQNGNMQLCQSGQNAIQTVAAEAGKTYKLNYTAKTAGTNQNVLFGIKFLSASWNVLGSEYSSFDSPAGFTSSFIQKAAPVGTAWVEVSIGKTNSGCVQVSEVCLEAGGNVVVQPVNPCIAYEYAGQMSFVGYSQTGDMQFRVTEAGAPMLLTLTPKGAFKSKTVVILPNYAQNSQVARLLNGNLIVRDSSNQLLDSLQVPTSILNLPNFQKVVPFGGGFCFSFFLPGGFSLILVDRQFNILKQASTPGITTDLRDLRAIGNQYIVADVGYQPPNGPFTPMPTLKSFVFDENLTLIPKPPPLGGYYLTDRAFASAESTFFSGSVSNVTYNGVSSTTDKVDIYYPDTLIAVRSKRAGSGSTTTYGSRGVVVSESYSSVNYSTLGFGGNNSINVNWGNQSGSSYNPQSMPTSNSFSQVTPMTLVFEPNAPGIALPDSFKVNFAHPVVSGSIPYFLYNDLLLNQSYLLNLECAFPLKSDVEVELAILQGSQVGQWKEASAGVVLRNKGNRKSGPIQVQLPPQSVQRFRDMFAYRAHDAYSGSFDSWTGIWTIPDLIPGAAATLNYYGLTKTAAEIPFFVQVAAQNAQDSDSQPNNNNSGAPIEDDEALVMFNSAQPLQSSPNTYIYEQGEATLYPNPASDYVRLDMSDYLDTEAEISMIDLNGRIAFRQSGKFEKQHMVQVGGLQNGVYLVQITSAKQRARVQKLVVEHGW